MKVLLDENLPQQLRHYFPGHETATVGWLGWSGTKNGKLLDMAEENGFDILITRSSVAAERQDAIGVIIFVAPYNALEVYEPLVPDAQEALKTIQAGEHLHIRQSARG